MKSILFTFEDDTTRDRFLEELKDLESDTIQSSLNTIRLDPPIKEDHERICGLWVGGEKLIEGPLSDLQKRFQQECDSHSANVVLKELRGGEWHDIRARRHQMV